MTRITVPAILSFLALAVLTGAVLGQHRSANEALLGVVAVQKEKDRVVIAHVLAKSAAAAAKLQVGDEIRGIDGKEVTKPEDVDKALASKSPGEKVKLAVRREKKMVAVIAKLTERAKYKGDFLKRQRRGATGFAAPAWHVYAWDNVDEGREPPTRENTKGKVVVFHCFQSW
ncbi:MAG: PDZ domain-containing protein [Planctomycetota bacterium]|jgi:predicted metalloprotease with PDZ domain